MKRVNGVLITVAVAAMLTWPGAPPASGTVANGEPAVSVGVFDLDLDLDLGVDIDVERGRIKINGALSFGKGHAAKAPGANITTPGPFERVRRGLAAARALGRATQCVVAHCWREWRGTDDPEEKAAK